MTEVFRAAPTTSFFSHCQAFTIHGGTFNHIAGSSVTQAADRDSSGLRIFREDEILLMKQLGQHSKYNLHSADTRGTAVAVKVFHGPLAQQCWEETSAINRTLMHPNFLRLLGKSANESPARFLVYNSVHDTVPNRIASVLRGNLADCVVAGINVVHCLSLALSYLEIQQFSSTSLGSESFDILVGDSGSIILGINSDVSGLKSVTESEATSWVTLLNTLCRLAFSDSSHLLYHDRVERSPPTALLASLPVDNRTDANCGSSEQLLRREMIWLPSSSLSLNEIMRETEAFLLRVRSSPNSLTLQRYHIAGPSNSAHRCIGYQREEVFISSQLRNSYLVRHDVPSPLEICTICENPVQGAQAYGYGCGGDLPAGEIDFSEAVVESASSTAKPAKPLESSDVMQHSVQDIQTFYNRNDVPDSELADICRQYQCQQEERQLRDAQVAHRLQLLLQKTPHVRAQPVPLRLHPRPRTATRRREFERSRTRKSNLPMGRALRNAEKPPPEVEERPMDDGFPVEVGDLFEKPKGFNLNPIGQTWDPEVNYYDPESCSKEPTWFDMAY
ncbi:hypothetical protein C8F04DRAFT_1088543 [Mycena alexandri]|uniref:Protein kinase domain-containing protein n=1 Tax=Mycena alexandri TaxID=1745969 RepID=A0AAD6T3J9_9AGAR|nr:hypothetical protein C8F04DRAFT_1088543 [Mycena alexandri]